MIKVKALTTLFCEGRRRRPDEVFHVRDPKMVSGKNMEVLDPVKKTVVEVPESTEPQLEESQDVI